MKYLTIFICITLLSCGLQNSSLNRIIGRKMIRGKDIMISGKIFKQKISIPDLLNSKAPTNSMFKVQSNIVFKNCIFEEDVSACGEGESAVQGIYFGEVRFVDCYFKKALDLSGSIFYGPVDFSESTFDGETNFQSSFFYQTARFQDATFRQSLKFQNARFMASCQFLNAEFLAQSSFQSAFFHDQTIFGGCKFYDYADFSLTSFFGPCNFNYAYFERHFECTHSRFSHNLDISNIKLYQGNMSNTVFLGRVNSRNFEVVRSLKQEKCFYLLSNEYLYRP